MIGKDNSQNIIANGDVGNKELCIAGDYDLFANGRLIDFKMISENTYKKNLK